MILESKRPIKQSVFFLILIKIRNKQHCISYHNANIIRWIYINYRLKIGLLSVFLEILQACKINER